MKRHEVQVLWQLGVTLGKITEATGVPQRSVQRIAHEPPVEGFSGARLALARGSGRPLVAVLDNSKTITLSHRGRAIEWNEICRQPGLN